MRRLLFLLPLALLLTGCKEKRYFTEVTGDAYLAHIVFDDENSRDFTVVCDVIYAGEDTSSRHKMVFYLPDGWDDSYPLFLTRYVPADLGSPYFAYQGMPHAEAALQEGNMIVVLVAYKEWTASPGSR